MGIIFKAINIPVKLFRTIITLMSMIWILLLIAIIVITIIHWDKIKNAFDNINNGMIEANKTLSNLSNKLNSTDQTVKDLSNKIAALTK